MYKFGKRSVQNLQTVDKLLQELASIVIQKSSYDFGILNSGGLRTAIEQNQLFKDGKSKCDGYKIKSYHQSGLAVDFVPYIHGYTWKSKEAFIHIAKLTLEAFKDLYNPENYYLHWGGFWSAKDLDLDGILEIDDKLGWDLPHFELRKHKQTKGVYDLEKT